jgi:hypothetical protein
VSNEGYNSVSVLLGTGDGNFGAATDFAVAGSPWSVAVGDFNGDGALDLVTANNTGDNVTILLNTCTPPTPTATPTVTPTSTPTATPTQTPLAVRGDNKNPARDRTDCQVEWFVANPNRPRDRFGLPKQEQICRDGDPSCDFKPSVSGVCEFQVAVCLNNHDPALPACIPNGITSVVVLAPRPELARVSSLRDILADDLAAVQNATQHLLDPRNVAAGFVNAPPLDAAQQHFCSAPFAIQVPVDVSMTRRTRRSVSIVARSTDETGDENVHSHSGRDCMCRGACVCVGDSSCCYPALGITRRHGDELSALGVRPRRPTHRD